MSLLNQLRQALQTPAATTATTSTPTSTSTKPPVSAAWSASAQDAADHDQRALERYRYLLRTASPEDLEQVHAEAFARLTPAQRQQVLDELGQDTALTAAQRETMAEDPQAMARMATRSELRHPGTLEKALSGATPGRMMAGGLLAGVAGVVVGSLVVDGLVDTGLGDGGLLHLGTDAPWAGGFDGPAGGGLGEVFGGGWFD